MLDSSGKESLAQLGGPICPRKHPSERPFLLLSPSQCNPILPQLLLTFSTFIKPHSIVIFSRRIFFIIPTQQRAHFRCFPSSNTTGLVQEPWLHCWSCFLAGWPWASPDLQPLFPNHNHEDDGRLSGLLCSASQTVYLKLLKNFIVTLSFKIATQVKYSYTPA